MCVYIYMCSNMKDLHENETPIRQKKAIFTNLKKKIRGHRACSKATRLSLTK